MKSRWKQHTFEAKIYIIEFEVLQLNLKPIRKIVFSIEGTNGNLQSSINS